MIPHQWNVIPRWKSCNIKRQVEKVERHLCAWGNDAASEVITEARQLLVENYFQTPSSAWV